MRCIDSALPYRSCTYTHPEALRGDMYVTWEADRHGLLAYPLVRMPTLSYGALMLPCAASLTCVSVQCLQHLRAPMFTLVTSAGWLTKL